MSKLSVEVHHTRAPIVTQYRIRFGLEVEIFSGILPTFVQLAADREVIVCWRQDGQDRRENCRYWAAVTADPVSVRSLHGPALVTASIGHAGEA